MLKLGSQGIAAIYLGGQKIKKAYLGEAVVFDTAGPPEPVTYTITLSVDPQGGGTVTGGGSVEEGMSVTVSSTPASGYTFSGWRENGAIVSTSPSYTFTVTSDRSLTAVFAAEVQNYNIVTSVDPAGAGTASGGGTYTQGQSVTLQATPASGYQFVAWMEGGAEISTDTSYTFNASGNRTITAVFAAITYTVTASTDPVGSGTTIITGTGTYQQGESVTVTASPDDGYKFVKWTEGGQTVSESASYTFTVSGDRALVAVFEAEQTSRLPAGYQELQYVHVGNYVGWNYAPYLLAMQGKESSAKIVELKLTMPAKFATTSALMLFGHNRSTSSANALYGLTSVGGYIRYQYGSGSSTSTYKNILQWSKGQTLDCSVNLVTKVASVNGTSVTFTSTSTRMFADYFSLGMWAGTSVTPNLFPTSISPIGDVDVYHLRIKDASGNLIYNFVPAKEISTGKVGFYQTEPTGSGAAFWSSNSNTSTNENNVVIAGPAV